MAFINIFKFLIFSLILLKFKNATAKKIDAASVRLRALPEGEVYFQVKTPTWSTKTTPNDTEGIRKFLTPSTMLWTAPSTRSPTAPAVTSITASVLPSSSTLIKNENDILKPPVLNDFISEPDDEFNLKSNDIFVQNAVQKDYSNFSVLLIKPGSVEQLNEILEFEFKEEDYNFWSHRRVLESPLTVLVPPRDTELRFVLREHKVDYTILIEDLGKVLEFENTKSTASKLPSLTGISFNNYLKYELIMDYLTHLSLKYPEIARLIKIGKTVEGRDITVMEVKQISPSANTLTAVLVEAGMHGRDWLSVSTALYVINQLVEHAAANKDMFEDVFWYILPVLNADGYVHSHSYDRLWKNNRKKYKNCTGVDLERNFDVGSISESLHLKKYSCTNLFPGEKPGSEPETRALMRFINDTKDVLYVYVSLHSGDAFVGYPWAHSSERPSDYENIVELATNIKIAIEERDSSSMFVIDRLYSLCGTYSGAAIDWAKKIGVRYPLIISLKGGAEKGFDIVSENIYETVVATFEGIRVITKHLNMPESMAIIIKKRDMYKYNGSNCIRFYIVLSILTWLTSSFFV